LNDSRKKEGWTKYQRVKLKKKVSFRQPWFFIHNIRGEKWAELCK